LNIDQQPPTLTIREQWKRSVRKERAPIFVRAIGIPYKVEIEPADDPSRVDHVWMTMECPPVGRLIVSINTLSRYNRDGGFDPRIRLGKVLSRYTERPEPVLERHDPLDYTVLEVLHPVDYFAVEHDPLEEMLITKCNDAVRAEVWGELYIREHLGIHQIHSRRASCAVARDIIGRDGGLRLYYRDGVAELLLFKFCGQ
jgi:hypothetical protein